MISVKILNSREYGIGEASRDKEKSDIEWDAARLGKREGNAGLSMIPYVTMQVSHHRSIRLFKPSTSLIYNTSKRGGRIWQAFDPQLLMA